MWLSSTPTGETLSPRPACGGDNRKVKTLHLTVDPSQLETPEADSALDCAAAILRAGGLVALPTETVYGLGANALDRAAVEGIFKAKQRPAWDPIIVHISDVEMLGQGWSQRFPRRRGV